MARRGEKRRRRRRKKRAGKRRVGVAAAPRSSSRASGRMGREGERKERREYWPSSAARKSRARGQAEGACPWTDVQDVDIGCEAAGVAFHATIRGR